MLPGLYMATSARKPDYVRLSDSREIQAYAVYRNSDYSLLTIFGTRCSNIWQSSRTSPVLGALSSSLGYNQTNTRIDSRQQYCARADWLKEMKCSSTGEKPMVTSLILNSRVQKIYHTVTGLADIEKNVGFCFTNIIMYNNTLTACMYGIVADLQRVCTVSLLNYSVYVRYHC